MLDQHRWIIGNVAISPKQLMRFRALVQERAHRRYDGRDVEHTLPRFDDMAALHRNPDGLRMSYISGLLNVSNGNITGIVDRLEDEGLAERRPVAGDRRAYSVKLTPAGLEDFEHLARAHEKWVDELLTNVSAAEAEELNDFIGRTTPERQIEAAE